MWNADNHSAYFIYLMWQYSETVHMKEALSKIASSIKYMLAIIIIIMNDKYTNSFILG
jgi:hypothetical protein